MTRIIKTKVPWKGYVIVGFPKCGQISMNHYLRDRFPLAGRVRKHEIAWKKDAIAVYKADLLRGGLRPIFMIRDPIARMWSAYHYFTEMPKLYPNPIDFLKHRGHSTIYGEENPVSGSNYWKWIRQWEEYEPLVIELRDMKHNPNYPNENKGEDRNLNYSSDVPESFAQAAKKALEIECRIHREPSWSIDPEFEMPW